ncbi:type IV secretory system conjugative DNA transfer family protein [Microvirga tunisiensis]|uniref:Type IV secretory system conjugative DNA transfer family protein n=1 Tax=Microvirga tunisiensis TaxID=2108360 RepID=A0A5N7MUL9_9HYPH|nr:type IV secretory system conjugative DNA transfer family protein [Microvirga tunisiensis]MPR09526.1 type IV secretory system conjugative DNA transfer family protein [Microvirga tunisiensis]MPR27746.1 type IV secretory system conjugative DNA transfer family protein [Microvirga tunisiensis]
MAELTVQFRNPFRRDILPDHMEAEIRSYRRWNTCALLLMVSLCLLAFLFSPLLWFLAHAPFTQSTFTEAGRFIDLVVGGNLLQIHILFAKSFGPGPFQVIAGTLWAYLACIAPFILPGGILALMNPYKNIAYKQGFAAWCDDRTLAAMEARKPPQVGIKGGYLMALGRWPTGPRKGQMVMMIESLSALCLAPPGTGKTAGLVVPTIVSSNNVSFVVNDPKPELWQMTAAYRSTVSHVFMLNWSKVDNPKEGIYYPRFNFLSPDLVPPPGPDRDTYIDSIAATMIPEQTGGGDSYFTDKGRAALTGFLHYIVARIADRKDAARYETFPERWHGFEPSIPMLADWIAVAQFDATSGDGPGSEDEHPTGGGGDKLGKWIRDLCDDIRTNSEYPIDHPKNRGKSERAFNELSSLVNMADKERSGVMGTMDRAFLPFKNAAVKERTSACDFTPDDLRGIVDPISGEIKPVTLYICVNQAEAQAFANVTALLYQVLSRTLLSFGPGETNDKTGVTLGPATVCFALDEFAKLPKIEAVMTGPDLGRGKKTSYMLVAQDYAQIQKIYSKEDESGINSTTAVKYILPQNNPDTVKRIQEMVGQTTIKDRNRSGMEGLSKQANPLAANVSEQTSGVNFLRTEDITALEPGKNIVLVQGFLNRPMLLDTPMYFKDKELKARVYYKGEGPEPTASHYLPEFIRQKRIQEYQLMQARKKKTRMAANSAEITKFNSLKGHAASPSALS